MDSVLQGLTGILVGVALLAVAAMFVGAAILFWRQFADALRERREADAEIERLGRRLPSSN